MRTVKFRAFIKNIGWVVPVEQINFDVETVEVDLSSGQADTSEYNFDEIELMQFTGLKDKNGVEIYEGDILEYQYMNKGHKELLLVRWSEIDGMWLLGYIKTDVAIRYSKVVGNVFENPEFLEGENNDR